MAETMTPTAITPIFASLARRVIDRLGVAYLVLAPDAVQSQAAVDLVRRQQQELADTRAALEQLAAGLAATQAREAALRAALAEYANPVNWNSYGLGPIADAWAFEEDGYERAQRALAPALGDAPALTLTVSDVQPGLAADIGGAL